MFEITFKREERGVWHYCNQFCQKYYWIYLILWTQSFFIVILVFFSDVLQEASINSKICFTTTSVEKIMRRCSSEQRCFRKTAKVSFYSNEANPWVPLGYPRLLCSTNEGSLVYVRTHIPVDFVWFKGLRKKSHPKSSYWKKCNLHSYENV